MIATHTKVGFRKHRDRESIPVHKSEHCGEVLLLQFFVNRNGRRSHSERLEEHFQLGTMRHPVLLGARDLS